MHKRSKDYGVIMTSLLLRFLNVVLLKLVRWNTTAGLTDVYKYTFSVV